MHEGQEKRDKRAQRFGGPSDSDSNQSFVLNITNFIVSINRLTLLW